MVRRDPAGLHAALVAAVSVAVFVPTLAAEFTYDDLSVVVGNPDIRYWHFSDLVGGWNRFVRKLTLMADYALYGDDPAGYHAQNLFWHALSSVLAYALLRRLASHPLTALAGALLFAVHPIHVEAVANVSNRKEMLCMSFSLASLLAYLRFLAGDGRRRWLWLGATGAAGLVAAFSKQVAVALPLAAAAYELIYLPREGRFLARHPLLLGLAFVAGAGLTLAYVLHTRIDLDDLDQFSMLTGYTGEASLRSFWATAGRAFWLYVGLLLWPAGLCPDHVIALSGSLADPRALAGWVGILAWATLAIGAARRAPLASFGLSWMLIHFLPISNLLPSAYVIADRYMYIPSLGFCALLAWLGERTHAALRLRGPHPPRIWARVMLAGLAALLVGGYALRTLAYAQHWMTQRGVWEYALACNPESHRAHYFLGSLDLEDAAYARAERHFAQALAIEPDLVRSHHSHANALFALGRHREALALYDRAVERWPQQAEAWYNRGNARAALGDPEGALADYDAAIERAPDLSVAYNNRGNAHKQLGRPGAALEDYRRAADLDPRNGQALFNLGVLLHERGHREQAIASLSAAATLGVDQALVALEHLRAGG